MDSHELTFVIPTYRLRDVSETVEQYDQHFWKNGHTLKLIVFDDSSPANQEKYYDLLEPQGLDRLSILGLEVAGDTVDLAVERHRQGVRITVSGNQGSLRVLERHS